MVTTVDPFPPLTDEEAAELEARWDENRRRVNRGGRPSARDDRPPASAKPASSTRRRGAHRAAPRRRRAGVTGRSYRRAVHQLEAPLERQLTSGMRMIGLTIAVAGLYLLLTNAGPFSGVLNGVNRGLVWLSDPTRSIPYAPGTAG